MGGREVARSAAERLPKVAKAGGELRFAGSGGPADTRSPANWPKVAKFFCVRAWVWQPSLSDLSERRVGRARRDCLSFL